jgi:hypothetical protein
MDNPVQVERSTGLGQPPPTELRSSSTEKIYSCRERVELLRSSVYWWCVYPVLHFVCTGLSMLKSYGLGKRE